MKTKSRVFFCFSIWLIIAVAVISFADIEDGLVGYWPFDKGSGETVFDATKNGNDGKIFDRALSAAEMQELFTIDPTKAVVANTEKSLATTWSRIKTDYRDDYQ